MTRNLADPRSGLVGGGRPIDKAPAEPPTIVLFDEANISSRSAAGSRCWIARSQHVLLEYWILVPGDPIDFGTNTAETAVLSLSDTGNVEARWQESIGTLAGRGLIAVPPGHCRVAAMVTSHLATSHIARLTPTDGSVRTASATNAADYAIGDRPTMDLWPEPVGSTRLRIYPLSEVAPDAARFGNIFRTRAFMVNFLNIDAQPRDPDKLSPHVHDDFDQLSLVTNGEYIHHVRMPWTGRSSEWQPDVHRRVGSPSVAVIRPGTIHTSQSVGAGRNALVDIFSPPRADFSAKPGWVLNSADYPVHDHNHRMSG